jgi:hypothetical protein
MTFSVCSLGDQEIHEYGTDDGCTEGTGKSAAAQFRSQQRKPILSSQQLADCDKLLKRGSHQNATMADAIAHTGTAPTANRPVCQRIDAVEWRRKLDAAKGEQGTAQAHIFADADGVEYLVKATNNPQGGKVVVNDLVGGLALEWLGVLRPPTAIVTVPQALIDATPDAKFSNGQKFGAGEAFGCAYWPSEPPQSVPSSSIVNLRDVAGAIALDAWFHNNDNRQWRGKLHQISPTKTFEFFPVDQGHCIAQNWDDKLAGGNTTLRDAPFALDADQLIRLAEYMEEYAQRLASFTTADAQHLVSEVPASWLNAAERTALTNYLEQRAPKTVTEIHRKYPIKAAS